MKTKLHYLLLLVTFTSFAQQYTAIPDLSFENALIALDIDSGAPDQKVLTSSINTLTNLDVRSWGIKDLTGIQDFVALKLLYCFNNQLTSLDVSKNVALVTLDCSENKLATLDVSKNIALTDLNCLINQLTTLDVSKNVALTNLSCFFNLLTSLDVSKNVALTTLGCGYNKLISLDVSKNVALTFLSFISNLLTSLDVSKNPNLFNLDCSNNRLTSLDVSKNVGLTYLKCSYNLLSSLDVSKNVALISLDCYYNQLTSLDVSQNVALIQLYCYSNQLTYLNLKNGKNTLLGNNSNFESNPNLSCIQVDDVAYSNADWANLKDKTAVYSTDCVKLGTVDHIFDKVVIFPIPTVAELHIDNVVLEKAVVYDVLGKLVQTTTFANNSNNNTLNLAGIAKGVYYVYLHSAGATTVKNIVVE
jgi:Secretion system C-terminal sorting domain